MTRFVNLHGGQNVMAYTASALVCCFKILINRLSFTWPQLPVGVIRTDARRNLITSIEIASSDRIIRSLYLFSNQLVPRETCGKKYTSSKFDAFSPSNYPALAMQVSTLSSHDNDFIRGQIQEEIPPTKEIWYKYRAVENLSGNSYGSSLILLFVLRLRTAVLETFGSGNA